MFLFVLQSNCRTRKMCRWHHMCRNWQVVSIVFDVFGHPKGTRVSLHKWHIIRFYEYSIL